MSQCWCTVQLWLLLNQAVVANKPLPLVCLWVVMVLNESSKSSEYTYTIGVHCALGKCLVWPPGDDKGIASLLSCREWGTICNLFLYIISWDQWFAGVLCPAGVHPSVSMTSKSVICFPFLCPIPFFFKTLDLFSISLLSKLSLFSILLSP